jgi:hypothetical protein
VCEEVGIDPEGFTASSKSPLCNLAKQVLVWVWVRSLDGSQAELARGLQVSSARVSKWYGAAAGRKAEIKDHAARVMARLERSVKEEDEGEHLPVQFRLVVRLNRDQQERGAWLAAGLDGARLG